MTETIQEIYKKAFDEEYDNILIRDIEMRIGNKIYEMTCEYLKELGLTNIDDGNTFRGEITVSEYDEETMSNKDTKYEICLVPHAYVEANSNNPEFSFD